MPAVPTHKKRVLDELACVHPNAAGLDIGSEEIVVAVPPDGRSPSYPIPCAEATCHHQCRVGPHGSLHLILLIAPVTAQPPASGPQ